MVRKGSSLQVKAVQDLWPSVSPDRWQCGYAVHAGGTRCTHVEHSSECVAFSLFVGGGEFPSDDIGDARFRSSDGRHVYCILCVGL